MCVFHHSHKLVITDLKTHHIQPSDNILGASLSTTLCTTANILSTKNNNNNSLPAGCLRKEEVKLPGWLVPQGGCCSHHGLPPVGSPEWQPRLQQQQQHRLHLNTSTSTDSVQQHLQQESPDLASLEKLSGANTDPAYRRGDRP